MDFKIFFTLNLANQRKNVFLTMGVSTLANQVVASQFFSPRPQQKSTIRLCFTNATNRVGRTLLFLVEYNGRAITFL